MSLDAIVKCPGQPFQPKPTGEAKRLMRELGVLDGHLADIDASTFRMARTLWISQVTEARLRRDNATEVRLNQIWHQLKKWQCAVCGGIKYRLQNLTCATQKCMHEWKYGAKANNQRDRL